jgi:Coenzyme PQQ synthesis protein D (PqqD)
MSDSARPGTTGATRYQVCSPQVIHETIDREVVIINLESGNYYSLRGTGARVWAGVAGLAGTGEIAADLARAYEGVPDAGASVADFLADLEAEGLIAPVPDGSHIHPTWSPEGPAEDPFQAPVLERFTDMQDLILLDPVHEVDEAEGWPRPRPAP